MRNIIAAVMIFSYLCIAGIDFHTHDWRTAVISVCLAVVNYLIFF